MGALPEMPRLPKIAEIENRNLTAEARRRGEKQGLPRMNADQESSGIARNAKIAKD